MPSIYWTRSVSRKSNGFSFLEGLCKLKNSSNLLTNAHIFRYRLIACHLDTEHNDWLWKLLWSNARQWYRDFPDYESVQMMLKGSFGPRPTDPFTILELQNPSYDAPELHEIRWSPDCKTLKLWKGRAGGVFMAHLIPCWRGKKSHQLRGGKESRDFEELHACMHHTDESPRWFVSA